MNPAAKPQSTKLNLSSFHPTHGLLHGHQPMFTTLITGLLSFLLLLLLYLHHSNKSGSKMKRPPGPSGLPIIGNLHQLGSLPHRSLAHLAKIYGPFMHLQLGRVSTLVVSSPKMAELAMRTHDHALCSRPIRAATNHLTYNSTDVAFAPYGPYWRHVRKICILELLSSKRVQSFRNVRKEEVGRLVDSIFVSSKAKAPVNLRDVFHSLTNNVVCRVALGKSYWEDEPELKEILNSSRPLTSGFFVGDFFPSLEWVKYLTGFQRRLEKNLRQRDSFLERVIAEHLLPTHKKEKKDLVDVLLELQKEGTPDFTLSRDNIKSVVMDMFAAGTATTATVLEWGMSELIKNRSAMKKAQDEVRGIAKSNNKSMIEEKELQQLHYLKVVVKEILRLHPPAPLLIPHESIEDCDIEGYFVPSKTTVLVNVWAIGRHPDSWVDPEEFRPERFIGSNIDYKGQDFALIPFGAGRRGCPGISFAMAILELALANLLLCFDWAMPDGMNNEDLDMTEGSGLSALKKTPLLLVATRQALDSNSNGDW
ncbi:hypothetical protein AMTRI_Chr06g198640 [Amborella trichopoda]